MALNSVGSAEAMLVSLDEPLLSKEVANSGLCCGCHTVKDKYYLLGGVMSGVVIDWVRKLLIGNDSLDELKALIKEAELAPVGSKGILFFPYLDGSGPPERDPNTWGSWLGLRLHQERGDLFRAVLEGLSYSSRHLLELFESKAGYTINELHAVGGGTRNNVWQQIKSNVIGRSIYVSPVVDVTALGSAMLAALGVGFYKTENDAVQSCQKIAVAYSVDAKRHTFYNQAYREVFLPLLNTMKTIPLAIDDIS